MAWTRRYDDPEPQRVNKWLAQSGVCSRREAEGLIAQGLVYIDGERVDDAGRKILTGQTLVLNDSAEQQLNSSLSIVLHKPMGIVSSLPQDDQIEAVTLLTREALWRGEATIPTAANNLAPLGRLDRESRGLLVLSEDGVLAKALIGPESDIDKEYNVLLTGVITPQKIALLRHGLELDGRKLRPAKVTQLTEQKLNIVLKEGRNRQIRRMAELVELRVVDLVRVRVGTLNLGDLPEGKWRPLSSDERAELIAASKP
ncbi:pseudouridylate synthase [Phenylobacterium sp. Root77]|uniref:pseudouridine synthase n=1 Tax=unclassified Phenylobacterium TaxID=2640670 RepID=UPI00070097A2|nr:MULTISPECIES: pseudouridine synthase [unclassified Phenylobacterium]KQW70675.1 pseudouridylate synthase [Phenylobacterium sp. Root1277]KQW90906.1 pseudouridylate synthase [Phenylobacterium sp. Root1290]KRC39463.1 pseudouridylate synthase [Phenylobacterium sp. Root77]